jgi:hypothetical protein
MIWGSCRSLGSRLKSKTFDEISGKAGLVKMDVDGGRHDLPAEVNSKKTFDNPHEINLAPLREETAEECLNLGILGEVNKVVHIQPKGE